MRRYWTRALSLLRRARELFPLTGLGLLVALGGALALFHFGIVRIDLVLLVIGIVALALCLLALLLVAPTALVLWLRLRRRVTQEPLHAECGFARRTGLSVRAPWYLPFVRVGWAWDEPRTQVRQVRQGLRLVEEILPLRRVQRDDIVRRFEVSDSFGLARVTFRAREARPLRFAPSTGALQQMHVIRSMAAGDELPHPDAPAHGERADMRHYTAGDPIRYILWKVFARTREVVVRTPERAIGPIHQTVAYLVAGRDDEPAAGAARVAVERGALGGDWVLGADGATEPVDRSADALALLCRSANVSEDASGAGLASFLERAAPGGIGRALVFVPARPGPWLERVAAAARRRAAGSFEIVVCADGVERPVAKRSWLRRHAWREEPPAPSAGIGPVPAAELAAVCRALAATGARVLVLDRLHGRVYTDAHQRALEAA